MVLQATLASLISKVSSHTVPHCPLCLTSSRPSFPAERRTAERASVASNCKFETLVDKAEICAANDESLEASEESLEVSAETLEVSAATLEASVASFEDSARTLAVKVRSFAFNASTSADRASSFALRISNSLISLAKIETGTGAEVVTAIGLAAVVALVPFPLVLVPFPLVLFSPEAVTALIWLVKRKAPINNK